MSKKDIGIKLLAKFTLSCLHCVSSRTEICQVTFNESEINMLHRCLNGIDPFFGGPDNLIATIDSLTCNPKVWKVFMATGTVSTLKGLVLSQPSMHFDQLLNCFLNMIPEPELFNEDDTLAEHNSLKLKNCVTEFLISDQSFMNLLQGYATKTICKGLAVLLPCPDTGLSGQ